MHFKPLFEVGWCLSYQEPDYRVPCANDEFIDKNRDDLADHLEFLAKAMRNGDAPFRHPLPQSERSK